MSRRRRHVNSSSFIFFILLSVLCFDRPMALFAEPVGGLAVNEESKQCAAFILGDECSQCELPPGWKSVKECPADYKNVGRMSPGVCRRLKDPFCCTVDHSGGKGDCDDVVVNDAEKKCAFVEDIARCLSLPSDWERPEMVEFWGKVCPSVGYQWIEGDLQCEQ